MQGTGLRDQAHEFEQLGCHILGASFDTPAENRAFREKFDFPFPLLCDVDRRVGAAYEVLRAPDDRAPDFPKRISYLIDPEGTIRRAYEVTDPPGHAQAVLADLRELTAG